MSLMKYAVAVVLIAIVMAKAEETKLSQNKTPLTSPNDNKQQNKRLAVYGSSQNSGFKPILSSYSSYPSVNNYVGNPQLFASAASNVYSQTPYNSYYPSPNSKYQSYSAPSYQQSYSHYQQPLAFAASHPAQVSYVQPPNNYAYSSLNQGPQYYAQQIPFNHFAFGPAQPINPVHHAQPVASFANSYQTPASTFYVNPQQIHKIPFYNQQPQGYSAASTYQPTNYHHQQQQHVKQLSPPSIPRQISISKPVALESPITPTSSSHVEHNHGAVSYTHVSSGERKPAAALPLIATQTPQQVYYHQQPQTFYNGDYSKQSQYAAVPIASNYYPTQSMHYGNVPYAQIHKIPTAASTLIPSTATPQKVAFH